jgi:hypothetical protein
MDPMDDETEGETYLCVMKTGDNLVVSFDARDGGVRNWRDITDSFAEAITQLDRLNLAGSVEDLDPGRRLGSGGRRRMSWPVFLLVWAIWDEERHVSAAFRRGSLHVRPYGGLSLERGWMRLARLFLSSRRTQLAAVSR